MKHAAITLLAMLIIGAALYRVELGPEPTKAEEPALVQGEPGPTGATYFVSYVYHTKENGGVAGYGYLVGGFPVNDFDAMQAAAFDHETVIRKEIGLKETLRSLSLISVQKL
jgi:hypothetical protein